MPPSLCTSTCNATTMVAHDENLDCLPSFNGDAYSVGYILCENANNLLKTDYIDETVWNTILSGQVAFSDLSIANGVVINMTSEIATSENPYKNGFENKKDGETFTLTITDPNVSCDNFDFYKGIDRRAAYIAIAFKDGRLWVSEQKFQLFSKTPSIENGAAQVFTIEASRKFDNGKSWACFATQPTGIFTY